MRITALLTVSLFVIGFDGPVRADPIEWPVSEGGNGHAYEVRNQITSWDNAHYVAEDLEWQGVPGHLATITSEAEHEFVRDVVGPCIACWLGAYQPFGSPEPDGGWVWVTGEAWGFTAWSPDEPNNDGNELFLMTAWWDDSHLWNDESWPPFDISGYIVEYDMTKVSADQSSWGQVKALYH